MQQLVTKIQNNPNANQPRTNKKSKQPYDLWNDDNKETNAEDELPFITKPVSKVHNIKICPNSSQKRKPTKPEPSIIPAVEIDVPGNSYNPTYEDHQDALGIAVAAAMEIDEKEEQIEKKLKPEKIEIPKVANEGLHRTQYQILTVLEQVKPAKKKAKKVDPNFSQKKTEQERKRQKRQKEIERLHRIKRSEKRRMRDIDRIKQIKKSIEKREKMLAIRAEMRKRRNEELLRYVYLIVV